MKRVLIEKKKVNKYNVHTRTRKGITLIALIVTIIILLILAGVIVNILFSDGGILKIAHDVVNTWNQATVNEQGNLNDLINKILENETSEVSDIDIGKEKLIVKDRKIVSLQNNKEFRMKGMAVGGVFNGNEFRDEEISEVTLKLLKEDGFNTIRFLLVSTMFYNYDTNEFNEVNIQKLKTLCESAEKIGIYIIVDMHSLKPGQIGFCDAENKTYCMVSEDKSEYTDGFIKMWSRLANELKNYKSVLAYELMNEPYALWSNSQEKALENYSQILQGCIDGIRVNDKNTIISFQPIFNYINASFAWTSPTSSRYPNIIDENLLLDSLHEYDNMLFGSKYDNINCTVALDTTREEGKGGSSEIYSNIQEGYHTYSIILESEEKAEVLAWMGIRAKNANGATISYDNYSIYKINEDNTETEIIKLNSSDETSKLEAYNFYDKLGKKVKITGDNTIFLENGIFTTFSIGLKPNEKIRIAIDLKLENYATNASINLEYVSVPINKNTLNQDLLCGYDKLEKKFKECEFESIKYGSPLYWGEFCVKKQYINDYTNYIEYIDAFTELSKKYNLSWIWFGLRGYPVDYGYRSLY